MSEVVRKGGRKPKEVQMEGKEVILTTYSQPHVLQQRMKEAGLVHDETATADVGPVRLEPTFGIRTGEPKMIMYFCPAQVVDVKRRIRKGDDKQLPPEATLKGVAVTDAVKPGLYMLRDVMLHSNGTMQVIATNKTKLEAV